MQRARRLPKNSARVIGLRYRLTVHHDHEQQHTKRLHDQATVAADRAFVRFYLFVRILDEVERGVRV